MTIVTVSVAGDFRSMYRHYMRKSKSELIRSVQDLQRQLGDTPDAYADLNVKHKDTLARMVIKLHDRFPE